MSFVGVPPEFVVDAYGDEPDASTGIESNVDIFVSTVGAVDKSDDSSEVVAALSLQFAFMNPPLPNCCF